MIGDSSALTRVKEDISVFGPNDVTVLIEGETGTGKSLVALLLHHASSRSPFVPVNCASVPGTLFESELFGHERGAFTGADRARQGLLEEASGGTLFLDEVGDLPVALQPKLLRALQEGEVRRVGSNRCRSVDVRLIAATNKDLSNEIQKGAFREDLFWRLRQGIVRLPPLRNRPEDIPPIVRQFLGDRRICADALALLHAHTWPGNVRELQSVLRVAALHAGDGDIESRHVSIALSRISSDRSPTGQGKEDLASGAVLSLRLAVSAFEGEYIQRVLKRTGGVKTRAAHILGIDRKTLDRKLRRKK